MKKTTTAIFQFQIPQDFEIIHQSKIGIRTENRQIECKVQHPHIEVRLFEIADLNSKDYKGDTLEEKWEDWCLSLNYKAEKISFEETTFEGCKTFVVHAHTDAPWNDVHFKLRYFHAAIFLDDQYFLEIKTIHEKIPSDTLDVWVLPSFESIEIIGDTATRHHAMTRHIADIDKNMNANLAALKTTEEKEKEDKRKGFCAVEIPADGKEFFKVGDFDFEFVEKETKISIGSFSNDVQVELKARTTEVKKGITKELLDDYPGDGLVSLTLPAKGIHVNGVPTGQLYFEEEKTNAPLFLHARSKGFDYKLAFYGSVTFDSGWVLLKGEMTKSYHDKVFPIVVAKKFSVDHLNWNDYRFTAMEETATANPLDVHYLSLEHPDFVKLPEELFQFKNLEELTISKKSNYLDEKKLPFTEIQGSIGQLTNLKKIYINNASILQLPKEIGELQNLEQLSINNCALKVLPNSVWQLPKLKFLWLSENALSSLPDEIDLPELQNISLDKNQLKTLPEILAKQPQLKRIKLEGNPLEHLPEAFNAIKGIELSMEDKLRLLDFGYKGADGNGLVDWNDSVFWSHYDDELVAEIDLVIKENELEEYEKALKPMVKKAVGFKHINEEDYKAIGNHRFGGMPDLPENIPYPRFGENWREDKSDYIYEFIGQINCAEIAHLQDYLPRTGTLFFFLETMHNIYGGVNHPGKIIYVEDNANLASGKRFNFTNEDYFEMFDEGYQGFKVSAAKINSAPSFYASYVNKHLFLGESAKIQEDDKLLDALYDSFEEPLNKKSPFEYAVNAHSFTQHEAPELQASLAKKGNPEDWITLLVVTSAGDMQWSDAGDIFYVIHKSDLAKRDFSNVFVTLESS